MTTASNRLFRGELNGDPLAALEAIQSELCYEASQLERSIMGEPPDKTDLDLAKSFRVEAQKVGQLRGILQKEIQTCLANLAAHVLSENLAGEWSGAISQALQDGCWERCAI